MIDLSSRFSLLNEPHMADLKRYVVAVRKRLKNSLSSDEIFVPHFDPSDAGTRARCLFLLESPGPQTRKTGFVSRDNPDATAENWSRLCDRAKLGRQSTVMWNAYPWFLQDSRFSAEDKQIAHKEIPRLLKNFPDLQVVVFVGKRAEIFWNEFHQHGPHLAFLRCPHPSNRHLKPNPAAEGEIVEALKKARNFLKNAASRALTGLTYTVEVSNLRQSRGLKIQFSSEGQGQALLSSHRPWRHQESGTNFCLNLPPELALEIARGAGLLSLPPISESNSGMDGACHVLELNSGMHQCHYSWWQDLPASWQSLRPLIEKLDGLFEKYPAITRSERTRT